MSTKEYLGDSVYAEYNADDDMVRLTTDNGYGATNTIFLELKVCEALIRYLKKVWEQEVPDEH